jgi:flagellar hook-associated protein 2
LANVQFGGLITGLDTKALIGGLVAAEHRTADVLENQKLRYQAQSGVLGAIVSALASLKSAAQGLSLSDDFDTHSTTSSDTSVLTASAGTSAESGVNTIVVDQLAKARIVKSSTYASSTDAIGTGTVTLTVDGKETAVTIGATNATLSGLKSAINSSGAAVTASIVNTGASDSPDYRLVVQSKNTGTANAVTISSALAAGSDPFAGGGTEVQAARMRCFRLTALRLHAPIIPFPTLFRALPSFSFRKETATARGVHRRIRQITKSLPIAHRSRAR